MGLDMYFEKRKKNANEEVGYFRKFNALHNFIVAMKGVEDDNLKEIFLTEDDVIQILNTLKKVSKNHELCDKLLPTQDGFFFGSTSYDEWYFKDVEEGVKLFEEVLNTFNFDDYLFIYLAWY